MERLLAWTVMHALRRNPVLVNTRFSLGWLLTSLVKNSLIGFTMRSTADSVAPQLLYLVNMDVLDGAIGPVTSVQQVPQLAEAVNDTTVQDLQLSSRAVHAALQAGQDAERPEVFVRHAQVATRVACSADPQARLDFESGQH